MTSTICNKRQFVKRDKGWGSGVWPTVHTMQTRSCQQLASTETM